MNPLILGVTEARAIDASGRTTKILVMTYKVGNLGPFTLETTAADIGSGVALGKIQDFARSLNALPNATS